MRRRPRSGRPRKFDCTYLPPGGFCYPHATMERCLVLTCAYGGNEGFGFRLRMSGDFTMTHEQVKQWLAAYSKAWESYDPQAIGELFSADAAYYYHPYDEPTRGRE